MRTLFAALVVPLVAACGAVPDSPDGGGADAAVAVDAAPDAPPPAPSIADALDCGTPASAGGLGNGPDLQRVDLDLAAFPAARCNDGTAAVFFFRPAASSASASRWLIQLQGGGSCRTPDECAQRWCSVDTNFGETQMTSTLAPATSTGADGILARGIKTNPTGDYNQVLIRYCLSDDWSGRSAALDVDAAHPITGAPVRYRIEFHGADILDAVLATLRRDGATPPDYTLDGGAIPLPDLDDASLVILAGASAGGAGVIANADRVGDALRATNPGLASYTALIDSIFTPDLAGLDWSTSTFCADSGVCTLRDLLAAQTAMYPLHGDDSCESWHAAFAPDTAYLCADPGHAIRNHVVTPFMLRQGQTDALISRSMIDTGVSVPGRGALTIGLFAELIHDQMIDMAVLPVTAEEGAAIARAPATFSPPCPDHETLSANPSVYDVTVVAGGGPRTMFDVFTSWFLGTTPQHAVWDSGDPIDCD